MSLPCYVFGIRLVGDMIYHQWVWTSLALIFCPPALNTVWNIHYISAFSTLLPWQGVWVQYSMCGLTVTCTTSPRSNNNFKINKQWKLPRKAQLSCIEAPFTHVPVMITTSIYMNAWIHIRMHIQVPKLEYNEGRCGWICVYTPRPRGCSCRGEVNKYCATTPRG